MKRAVKYSFVFLVCTLLLSGQSVQAENHRATDGHITFTGDYDNVGIQDPEHPETTVEPGASPSTSGKLRIDFVPQFNFTSIHKITKKDTVYPVNAQLFHDETTARGNFIQISDYRGAALGWTLQVRQETQFQNKETVNSQLNGAVLSLDQSWTSSKEAQSAAPLVSKEVIRLDNIGATYNLAEAVAGTGYGTWSISFGASKENPLERTNTLAPKLDRDGQPLLDSNYAKKQMYENRAITLFIPGSTKKDPVNYSTVLTWLLAELP